MMDSHSWSGSFVESMGYVGRAAHAYGSSMYPDSTFQTVYTLGEYIQSGSLSGLNQVSGFILGNWTRGYSDYLLQEMGDMNRDIQATLSDLGYCGNKSVTVVNTRVSDYEYKTTIYDVETGKEVTSRIINLSTGSWR